MLCQEMISDVKKLFENDFSGHDLYHTLRVMNTAEAIANSENADIELCRLAALLHDTDDYKLAAENAPKHQNAAALMDKYDIPTDTQKRVFEIIESVSFKGVDSITPDTIEAQIVQDADRLDAMGAIGIARAFAYGGSRGRAMHDPDIPPRTKMTEEQYKSANSTTINHFYEKLLQLKDMMNTSAAKAIAEHRHRIMLDFLTEFDNEWNNKMGCI